MVIRSVVVFIGMLGNIDRVSSRVEKLLLVMLVVVFDVISIMVRYKLIFFGGSVILRVFDRNMVVMMR